MSCSLLIITNKEKVQTLDDPLIEKYVSETLIDKSKGVAHARNRLAYAAQNDILVFIDDDVKLEPELWDQITQVQPHQILMAQGYQHPITRVMAIRKRTFFKIGGFDEKIKYNGEDLDFYWRALNQGYMIGILPGCQIHHEPHKKSNWSKYHFESAYTRVKHGRISLDFFVQTNPIIALLRLAGFIYHKMRLHKK